MEKTPPPNGGPTCIGWQNFCQCLRCTTWQEDADGVMHPAGPVTDGVTEMDARGEMNLQADSKKRKSKLTSPARKMTRN